MALTIKTEISLGKMKKVMVSVVDNNDNNNTIVINNITSKSFNFVINGDNFDKEITGILNYNGYENNEEYNLEFNSDDNRFVLKEIINYNKTLLLPGIDDASSVKDMTYDEANAIINKITDSKPMINLISKIQDIIGKLENSSY